MKILKIRNLFNAPVYHEDVVSSTMDISRRLCSDGAAHGTVITADFQEEGRGRIRGRTWEMERELNLPLTLLLRFPRIEDIPPALTLRTGLAVSLAIEEYLCHHQSLLPTPQRPVAVSQKNHITGPTPCHNIPETRSRPLPLLKQGRTFCTSEHLLGLRHLAFVPSTPLWALLLGVFRAPDRASPIPDPRSLIPILIKWPNDIMIGAKKMAGILCEADGGNVFIGIGINFAQKEFPAHLREKATSVALAAGVDFASDERFVLLEKILEQIFNELESGGNTVCDEDWKTRLEQRLYKKGEQIAFIDGAADSGKTINGRLAGIGHGGELLIVPDGEKEARAFVTGELVVGSI